VVGLNGVCSHYHHQGIIIIITLFLLFSPLLSVSSDPACCVIGGHRWISMREKTRIMAQGKPAFGRGNKT